MVDAEPRTDSGPAVSGRADRPSDRSPAGTEGDGLHGVVRSIALTDGTDRDGTADVGSHTSAAASADAVDALRRSVRDLKHDVRMLKVVVDKQSALIETLARRLDGPGGHGPTAAGR